MDFSMMSAAASAITVSKELAKAAIGIRDFNEMASVIAKLNEQLLKAQEGLFAHQAQLLVIQQQHADANEKVRKLEKALAERGRYSLVEVTAGYFAYRSKTAPMGDNVGEPISSEPIHHVCQRCFDSGVKCVLQRVPYAYGGAYLTCGNCHLEIAVN
jgi:hypothetical protein